jgi:hypothetical protein
MHAHAETVSVNRCTQTGGDVLPNVVASAAPGSTLLVQAGTYPEPFTIQKNVTINSPGGTVLVGQPLGTQKICQLTGEQDLFSRGQQFTVNQTETNYGLRGVDLGASFEHNGRIYFLFGDTIPSVANSDDNGNRPVNGDSIAWIPADADPEQCLRAAAPPVGSITPLTFLTATDGKYLSPRVLQSSTIIPRSAYDVPTSGFSANGHLYAFFTTDHTDADSGPPFCYPHETMRRSVLARLDDEPQNRFTYLYDVSCRPGDVCNVANPPACSAAAPAGYFINISPVIVNNDDVPGLPDIAAPQGQGLLLWGSGRYRCSLPYLAYVPLDSVEDSSRQMWRYAVIDTSGQVHWSACESAAIPLFNEVPACIGEFSVAWNAFLHKWIMLYNCATIINYRVADQPWGPWSDPLVLFDPGCDRGYCRFLHSPGCPDSGKDDLQDMNPQRFGGA